MGRTEEEIESWMEDYAEVIPSIAESDDSYWPDWLFKPVYNDFGNNYYTQSFAEDDLTTSMKRLKRRYNNFFEYVDAMEIYNEYMDKMIEKYGSLRTIKNNIEADVMDDPIPSKPKLKNNRRNRQFLRSGAVPSRKNPDMEYTKDEMLAIARQALPGLMGDSMTLDELDRKPSKKTMKRLAEIQSTIERQDRRRSMYRRIGSSTGTDFIVEYLNQAKRGVFNSHGESASTSSILDIVKEMEYEKNTPPELLEDEKNHTLTPIIGHRLVNASEHAKTEILKELHLAGYDIFHGFGSKGMSKKSVKMLRSELGASAPLTKKELKKIKKRSKKEATRIQQRADADAVLERTLLGNKINAKRNANGDISFRLSDLYSDV